MEWNRNEKYGNRNGNMNEDENRIGDIRCDRVREPP